MRKRKMVKNPSGSAKQQLMSKALGPATEEFGEEIRPIGKEVGTLTVRAARALLKPVGALVWGFEKVEEWIAASIAPKIDNIPPENRVEPQLIVAGPTIDAMKYCGSEPHLRDLFANLLVTSMDSRFSATAHPAFVEMVKQISPDEARILKFIARGFKESQPLIEVYASFERLEKKPDGTPIIGFYKSFGPYCPVAFYAGCKNQTQVPAFISNLARLEIIKVDFPANVPEGILEELLSMEIVEKFRKEITGDKILRGSEFRYRTGWMTATPLEEQFFDACVRERQIG
jgi:hypothetical protein